MMKDCSGRILQYGFRVATTIDGLTYALKIGQVIGFTEKKVRVKMETLTLKNESLVVLKFPEQLCVID